MSFWKTKKFRELSKQWDTRLKQSGFKDAEEEIGGERLLRQHAGNFSRQETQDQMEARVLYHDLLRYGVENSPPENPIHLYVMQRAADGAENKQIRLELLERGMVVKRNHTIGFIIRRYEHVWGIKSWSAKQRGLKS